jgi:hypothetical protein
MTLRRWTLAVLGLAAFAGCGRQAKGPAIYVAGNPVNPGVADGAVGATRSSRTDDSAIKDGLVVADVAAKLERLGAAELRRYLYLCTGELSPIVEISSWAEIRKPGIIISRDAAAGFAGAGAKAGFDISAGKIPKLGPEEYWLKTVSQGGRRHVLIAGGDALGALYGVYAFLEKLGVRFYLDGDVVPDERFEYKAPDIDEIARPLFKLRGIQPFHDFPEGPDWWNEDTYKAVLGQLPKLRMNFFGLHTYPEKGPNAEPTVWIGPPGEAGRDGRVTASYPSSYQNTARVNPGSYNWGFRAKKTSEFHFGAGELFESDAFGPEVMDGLMPEPKSAESSNELFNRTADMLRGAFTFARALGVKTCVGTETPLTVPALVQERLKAAGMDPKDPKTVRELYKGIFQRIAAAYPIDYYWFWTNENWTWSDAGEDAVKAVVTDLDMAVRALEDAGRPFGLATCGWVLGPPGRRTLFDEILPKSLAASCINREVGKAPVDPTFARISERSKWAIPWLEDDPSLTSPQLWVGRMRRDAVDALKYGCDGLMGIHWRTRILSANAAALAHAAWDQSWNTMSMNFADLVGPINGQNVVTAPGAAAPAAKANDEAVYKDVRDRVTGYRLLVPAGTYAVTLKFIEGEFDRKGARVFDVVVQGKTAAEKLDIFERAGKLKAYDLVVKNVAAPAGRLVVDFVDRIHYPSIAGLVIEGTTAGGDKYLKKINCGGPKVLDYEADWPETPRHIAALEFYRDWARAQFGRAAVNEIADVFAGQDGRHPVPVTWTDGPGGIVPNAKAWDEVRKDYAFVDVLAALRPRITGRGSLERFDYWLKSFEYMREVAQLCCLWGEFNTALDKANALPDAPAKARAARETLLPIRVRMVESARAIMGALLATAGTTGELGTIANWEQHNFPAVIDKPGDALRKLLGAELPPEASLASAYEGPIRIIVPTVRPGRDAGESLKLKVIVLAAAPPQDVTLFWRALGGSRFEAIPLRNIARSVYTVELPASAGDVEYYIRAAGREGDALFPATAPALNQTVIIIPR